jgi:hypothetical protein
MEDLEKAAWSLASKFKSGGPGTSLGQDYIVRVAILVSHLHQSKQRLIFFQSVDLLVSIEMFYKPTNPRIHKQMMPVSPGTTITAMTPIIVNGGKQTKV